MQPFIPKPYLIKIKICFFIFLSLFFILTHPVQADSLERSYYFFLLSQIYSENLEEAEENLKKALKYVKDSFFLKKNLLLIYLQNNKLKEAEKLGEELYKKNPYDRELNLLLGKYYLQKERPNRALQILEKYIENSPKDEGILSLLISIYLQQKEWDQALKKLGTLIEKHPQSPELWLFKARIYREKKDFPSAKASYLKALELAPENRPLLLEILSFLESTKDYNDLEIILKNYLVKNPEDRDFLRLLISFYLEHNLLDKSEEIIKSYLEKKKREEPELLFYLGLTLEYKDKKDAALKIYKEIPLASPWHLEAQKRIFEILRKKDLAQAKAFLEDLKKEAFSEKGYFLFLSQGFQDIDECKEGIKIAQKGLSLMPDDPDLLLSLANNYACLEDYEQALETVFPLLKKFHEDPYVLNFVGYSLVELERDLDKAEELLRRSHQLKPKDPYILDSLGWLYYKKGDLEKAQEYLELAVKHLHTDEPVIWEHLADLYLKKGLKDSACALYKKAWEKSIHKKEKERLNEKVKKCN